MIRAVVLLLGASNAVFHGMAEYLSLSRAQCADRHRIDLGIGDGDPLWRAAGGMRLQMEQQAKAVNTGICKSTIPPL